MIEMQTAWVYPVYPVYPTFRDHMLPAHSAVLHWLFASAPAIQPVGCHGSLCWDQFMDIFNNAFI